MTQVKLTKTFIDGLDPAKADQDHVYWDTSMPGFGIRVKPPATLSYVIQYRTAGQSRRMTLGKHGRITLEKARKEAKKYLGQVTVGQDPARERAEQRAAPTMKELAADYLERHAVPKKRPASVRDDRSMLDRFILPKLGSRKVNAITRREIEGVTNSLAATPYTANRVRALLSKMFSLAVGWAWRPDNPVANVAPFPETARERWLREDEIDRLFAVLDAHSNQSYGNAIRLLLFTGARRSEVLKAEWSQFDLENGLWTKPAHTTKQRRLHHVPLSSEALSLLRSMRAVADGDQRYLFPGRPAPRAADDKQSQGQERPLQEIRRFWHEVRREAGLEDVRLHDLRHTFASHIVSAGVSLPMVGQLLGHTQAATTQRYAHLAVEPLRAASDAFGRKLRRNGSRESGERAAETAAGQGN